MQNKKQELINKLGEIFQFPNEDLDYEIEIEGKIFRPGGVSAEEQKIRKSKNPKSDWCWRWSKDLFEFGYKHGFIEVRNNRIYTKTYEKVVIEKINGKYKIVKKERKPV